MSSVLGTWKLHAHKLMANPYLDTSQNLAVTKNGTIWTISFKTKDGTSHAPTQTSSSDLIEIDLTSANTTTIKARLWETDLLEVIIGIVYKGTMDGVITPTDADVFLATRTTPG